MTPWYANFIHLPDHKLILVHTVQSKWTPNLPHNRRQKVSWIQGKRNQCIKVKPSHFRDNIEEGAPYLHSISSNEQMADHYGTHHKKTTIPSAILMRSPNNRKPWVHVQEGVWDI
jgi:hypothetical protein